MIRAELKVIGGKQHGRVIGLTSNKFLIGREQDCHLRPNNESISRHHCVLSIDDYGVRIRDLGSTNGSFVNGKRVQSQVELKGRDRILVGKLEFEVLIHEAAVAATQPAETTASPADDTLANAPDATVAPTGGETILDLPIPQELGGASGETAVLSGDTTIIPNTASAEAGDTQVPLPAETPEEQPTAVALQQPDQQQQPETAANTETPEQPAAAPETPQETPAAVPPPPLDQQAPQQPAAPQPMPQQPMMPQAPMVQPGMPQQPYMPQQMAPDYMQQQMMQQQMMQQQMMQQQYYQQQQMQQPMMPEETEELETDAPPMNLPDPSETGAKPPEPPKAEEASEEGSSEKQESTNPAADIIRQYMNRRGT